MDDQKRLEMEILKRSPSFKALLELCDYALLPDEWEEEKSDPFGTLHPYHPLLQRSSHPQEFFNMDLGGKL